MPIDDVADLIGDQIAVVGCEVSRRIAAREGSHCVPAALGQDGPEVAPGPGGIRVPVDEQGKGRLGVSPGQGAEGHAGCVDTQRTRSQHTRFQRTRFHHAGNVSAAIALVSRSITRLLERRTAPTGLYAGRLMTSDELAFRHASSHWAARLGSNCWGMLVRGALSNRLPLRSADL